MTQTNQKVDLGSAANNPQRIGDILDEMLLDGMNRNTDLCVDLKTLLWEDRIAKPGKSYNGMLLRDMEDHFIFFEAPPSTEGKRNEHVFRGEYVNITRRDDGTLRANFKTIKVGKDCSVDDYAFGAFAELRQALKGLVEKTDKE